MMLSDFVHEHEFIGLEYDWAAIDKNGYVGYFSSAGAGPIPKFCILEPALFDELFEKTISMVTSCESIQLSGYDRDVSDWVSIAQKGFYTFDWRRELSVYQLIAKPKKPIKFNFLNSDMRDLIGKIKLCCSYTQGVGLEDLIAFR